MIKQNVRILSILLCLAVLCAVPTHASDVEPCGSAQIAAHQTSLAKGTDGVLYIVTSVTTNRLMNKLGTTSVELQQFTGKDWDTIATYTLSQFPEMMETNTATHTLVLTFRTSRPTATYRALAHYYAESDTMISTVTSASNSVSYP